MTTLDQAVELLLAQLQRRRALLQPLERDEVGAVLVTFDRGTGPVTIRILSGQGVLVFDDRGALGELLDLLPAAAEETPSIRAHMHPIKLEDMAKRGRYPLRLCLATDEPPDEVSAAAGWFIDMIRVHRVGLLLHGQRESGNA